MLVWNDFRNDARVRKEAETLCADGHAVTVYALHTPGETHRQETLPTGVQVSRVFRSPLAWIGKNVPRPPAGRIGLLWRLATRATAHLSWLVRVVASRPDVVHAHDVNTLPTAWLAARLSRARLVYDAHEISTDREGYKSLRNLVGWVEKRLMRQADAAITTTDARAKFFARAYKVPRPLVLQNRPRIEPLMPSSRLREELGIPADQPIILYQGGLQPGRGLERLVAVAPDIPDARVVFIGGGRLADILAEMARDLRVENRVHFIPTVPLDELPSYTRSADIGVQPIENTCFNHFTTDSNKLFEYIGAGLPVVATALPEIRRIVREHRCGVLVPPGDTEALQVALANLVADPAARAAYRQNAIKAAGKLNWEDQEARLRDLYRALVRDKNRKT
jgi:glycosyltransferase involved in cell wall biosynthesis